MKKGFTLIELLAVIIVLAIIALIATPLIMSVVDNARESARKSSVLGYVDAVKLAVSEYQFANGGKTPDVNVTWANENVTYQGGTVSCVDVANSSNYGVIVYNCTVGSNDKDYCYANGKVYKCDDTNYLNIYNQFAH